MSETDQGQVQLGRVFRRPGDGAGALRVEFVSGDDSIIVKFQRTTNPRLVKFLAEHLQGIPVEARPGGATNESGGDDAASDGPE